MRQFLIDNKGTAYSQSELAEILDIDESDVGYFDCGIFPLYEIQYKSRDGIQYYYATYGFGVVAVVILLLTAVIFLLSWWYFL